MSGPFDSNGAWVPTSEAERQQFRALQPAVSWLIDMLEESGFDGVDMQLLPNGQAIFDVSMFGTNVRFTIDSRL